MNNSVEKIVITGGLGYIGSELVKLYSGESRFKQIVVVDKKFISERVKQLRDWGIEYINASILDKPTISKIVSDADVVIHLAGITDVAYVKTDSNEQQDKEIRETGIDGTRNIISSVKSSCKVIFPSTHVVFEGFETTKTEIDESELPCPVLTYSTGKRQSELDLIESSLDYVVLRLGSVYGYSTDTMRIGIMPNLFSKIASQNGTIKLFSGGVQIKSLVPVYDVARCIKYMAENKNIKREIFHVSLESMTVKEVAEICKEINPNLNIVETKDEIPNLGYTISNKKLLSTGFKFRYGIKNCIKEMIDNWSDREINHDLEYIDRGGKEFIDSRGRINNYELTEPINMIGYIESKRGSVRANHYHPIQEQKCLLIKGQYISVIKDLSCPNSKIETRVINEGDIAIIKPNVAHAMIFTEDSIFLNLVRGEREHENYGVTHTIPYKLVTDELRDKLLECYTTSCRSCGNKHLERVVSLGMSPLANNLVSSKEEKVDTFPLEMNYCSKCHNCQLSVAVPATKMFDNYLYVSSTASSFRKHFEDAAILYQKQYNLSNKDLVIDIGSNDGIALKPLKNMGVKTLGVEPAKNIAEIANRDGIETINAYFTKNIANTIVEKYGRAKLITASNVFAHADKLSDIAMAAFSALKEDGVFIVEVQYLLNTISDMTFDNIYHEHTNYWSVSSMKNFFNSLGKKITKVEKINTHGGSIRVYVENINSLTSVDNSVEEMLDHEKKFGLLEYKCYSNFGKLVEKTKETVRNNFCKLKSKYGRIVAYGSPAKATTSLNYYGLSSDDIDFTIDDNSLKIGKLIPCVNIPIKGKSDFGSNPSKVVLVLAWNFFDLIVKNNKDMIDNGTVFINIKDLENPNFSC